MATQVDVAKHLFLTDKRIRDLAKRPGAPQPRGRKGYDIDEWRRFYIDYLKGLKVGEGDDFEPEMGESSERLSELKLEDQQLKNEERREGIELKRLNRKIKAREYAPIWLISDAVQGVSTAAGSRVDGWMPRLKLVYPDMPLEIQEMLQKELVILLNELSTVQPDFSGYVVSDQEGDFEGVDASEEEGSADRG